MRMAQGARSATHKFTSAPWFCGMVRPSGDPRVGSVFGVHDDDDDVFAFEDFEADADGRP